MCARIATSLARRFHDQSAPYDTGAEFHNIGPAVECPDVASAVKRRVVASTTYHSVRTRCRDEGALNPRTTERLAWVCGCIGAWAGG